MISLALLKSLIAIIRLKPYRMIQDFITQVINGVLQIKKKVIQPC